MTIQLHGDVEMKRRLFTKARFFPTAVGRGLKQEAEIILRDSQRNYVPIDRKDLHNSGRVEEPDIRFLTISVTISYGGPNIPHAQAVHEHPSEHSPPSWVAAENNGNPVQFNPAGRGPKYLEKPLLAASGVMNERLTARLRHDLVES